MKKTSLLIILILLCGCNINKKTYISKRINQNIDNCKIESDIDTHSGFLGDGEYFAKLNCSNINTKNWEKLPLSNDINKVMNMDMCNDKECKNVYERYNIPKIENGYYYFLDRQNSDIELNERASYNFSLAIYNIESGTIYYYELDT